ncbi:MAG: molybdopterin-guanine dinucleotide biosynthesis protein B [Candidatus Hodarchaeota archaeon]
MKIVSVIGYSGSGKTFLISNAIKLLKQQLNLKSSVIKNVHKHEIDVEEKDSYKFADVGAQYSIIRNNLKENAIFIKKDIEIKSLIELIEVGPLKTDILFIEGFRNLNFPTILCVKNFSEIKSQLTKKVKMISGLVTKNQTDLQAEIDLPIIDIINNFERFLNIFKIR